MARDKFVPLAILFRVWGRIVDDPGLDIQVRPRATEEKRGHPISLAPWERAIIDLDQAARLQVPLGTPLDDDLDLDQNLWIALIYVCRCSMGLAAALLVLEVAMSLRHLSASYASGITAARNGSARSAGPTACDHVLRFSGSCIG
jgi:hypothetical protein